MTWLILGAIFAVWLVVQGGGINPDELAKSVCNLGMVPGAISTWDRLEAVLAEG